MRRARSITGLKEAVDAPAAGGLGAGRQHDTETDALAAASRQGDLVQAGPFRMRVGGLVKTRILALCTAILLVLVLLGFGLIHARKDRTQDGDIGPVSVVELSQTTALSPTQVVGLVYARKDRTQDGEIGPVATTESSETTAPSPTQVVSEILGRVNKDRALNDLRRLTGEEPVCTSGGCWTISNRPTGSSGLDWAMDYISEELVSLGYSVESEDWSRSGYSGRNLIARKSGVSSPTEEVYFVAHVDGVKIGAAERFPAADDNGSGSVGLLEVARVLSTFPFSRTVVLLFTTGEEQGTLGSRSYLERLSPPELGSIKYVVNVDVIGYDANGDQVIELVHGGDPPSQALARVMGATIEAHQLDLDQRMIVGCP